MKKAIWITWEQQVRNRSMAAMLRADLYVILYSGGRMRRYFFCLMKTIATVLREKPNVVFAPNPSIVLNYLLLLARMVFRYTFVTDAHFGGIIAWNGSFLLQKALNFCNKSADLVIVTNSAHANYVQSIGGKALICEDPLPDLTKYYSGKETSGKIVFFICSFDVDEPHHVVFEAAKILAADGFKFYVSGNYTKEGIEPTEYPEVSFLGFTPEHQFYERLFQADVVVDLTENENCLVCGAYEAMVAEKPLVTSDTVCLRNFFDQGTVFTEHNSSSVAEAVRTAYLERSRLKAEIQKWKERRITTQNERKAKLYTVLNLN